MAKRHPKEINRDIKTFSFLDESGLLVPSRNRNKSFFGLGFIKYENPFQINQVLHKYHQQLCADLKKDDTRIEFSFKGITEKTLQTTLKALNILEQDMSWEFNCIYFDTMDPKFNAPQNAVERWEMYITNIKLLIKKNLWRGEETILIADFLQKPKTSNKKFEYMMTDILQVYNVLQVISHGVLLVQLADVLLGAFLYREGGFGDQEGYKLEVANRVQEIRKKVGRNRFNTWKRDWDKSSR
jgi:hypothetical protein